MMEESLDLKEVAPDPEPFARALVNMHKASQSPNERFGFAVTTCDGPLPHPVEWGVGLGNVFRAITPQSC